MQTNSRFHSLQLSDAVRGRITAALSATHRLERELIGGGMARVFVATERALGRQVVIKTLPDETWTSSSVQRFHREILTAAQLQHANIVPVLAAGGAEGMPYFTLPLVDGATLRQRMARGAVPLNESISILRDVARGLNAAHARGVVHRDIKPEQIAADPSLDQRADLYAWGVVAYELLIGQRSFATWSGTALARAQMTELPPPLRSSASIVPESISPLVMQCLPKAPDERPGSAHVLLEVLDQPSGAVLSASRKRTALIASVIVLGLIAASWWAT